MTTSIIWDPPATVPDPTRQILLGAGITRHYNLQRGRCITFWHLTLPPSQLRVHYSGAWVLQGSTCSLILRSSCNLQRLCIEKQHIYDEDLIPCLESVPSALSHLLLVVLGVSKIFVLMMHSSHDSEPLLLPKLTWFHYEGSVDCDSHSLVDMLSERWSPQQPAQKPQHYPNRHPT